MRAGNVDPGDASTKRGRRPRLDDDQVTSILASLESGFGGDPAAVSRVAVVLGAGAKVRVERCHLVVSDGEGWFRRERRWNRATGELRRLVVGAESGFVTIAALAWCRDVGVSVVILDSDGDVTLASAAGLDDGRLRRVQAAPPAGMDVAAARSLLVPKLAGQAAVLRDRFGAHDTALTLDDLAHALDTAHHVDECRQLEASAAALYWQAWCAHPTSTLRFARHDTPHVPAHWALFDGRRSLLARGVSARKAERPLNALLNLLYKLAGIEARLACVAVGLDPALGFVHTDMARRDSLALDLLEPVRPLVDRLALDIVAERTFTRADFHERSDGSVRIAPQLVQELAATMPAWSRAVGPHAEALAHLLGSVVQGKWEPTTRLSGRNQRAAQAAVRARRAAVKRAADAAAPATATARRSRSNQGALFATCLRCGGPLNRSKHVYCERCWDTTPAQSRETRRRRGQAIAAALDETRRFDAEHVGPRPDRDLFAPIRDGLAGVKLAKIMAATGLSKTSASMVRAGKTVPHVRHWRALERLGQMHAE